MHPGIITAITTSSALAALAVPEDSPARAAAASPAAALAAARTPALATALVASIILCRGVHTAALWRGGRVWRCFVWRADATGGCRTSALWKQHAPHNGPCAICSVDGGQGFLRHRGRGLAGCSGVAKLLVRHGRRQRHCHCLRSKLLAICKPIRAVPSCGAKVHMSYEMARWLRVSPGRVRNLRGLMRAARAAGEDSAKGMVSGSC
mmetsp:Transcript_43913/g.87791  ORF Transcript_43913/g.87791 Transcript_43913/m.87791 type:complete len:207 (+) Transcript_43913:967-1587(+)